MMIQQRSCWYAAWIILLLYVVKRSNALCQQSPPSTTPSAASHTHQHHYLALYKPALTLCTFRDDQERAERKHRGAARSTLSSFNLPTSTSSDSVVEGLHMCGRLDRDSEGLLLLTTDGQFTSCVCEPDQTPKSDGTKQEKVPKRYLARVRNLPTEEALQRMRQGGLVIRGATTRPPVSVRLLSLPNDDDDENNDDDDDTKLRTMLQMLPKPVPGMEDRQGSYAWLEIVLTEGRNRQVRRITAEAGHPTVRLIRVAIGNLSLADLDLYEPGQWCSIDKEDVLGASLS